MSNERAFSALERSRIKRESDTLADAMSYVFDAPGPLYSDEDIVALLDKAESLGFSLEAGSILEHLTLAELQRLVTVKH